YLATYLHANIWISITLKYGFSMRHLSSFYPKELQFHPRKKTVEERLKQISTTLPGFERLSSPAAEVREERSKLKDEIQDGVSQRKIWSARVTEIEKLIKDLKSNELQGVGARDSRAPSTPRRGVGNLPASLPCTPTKDLTPLRFSSIDSNHTDLPTISEENTTDMEGLPAEVDVTILDNEEYLGQLLDWQPTSSQAEELQARFQEIFTDN
ncbi:hypothetical protein H0H81_006480, partial [Sphagnurus paluster]